MSASRSVRFALPGLVLGAVLIGLAPIFVRLATVGPTAAAFWRVFLALPVLYALQQLTRDRAAPRPAESTRYLWLAGLAFAGDLAVWHQSIHLTSVANSTLLTNLAPVFLTLALHFGFGEKHVPRFWLGLALALGGAAVLMWGSLRIGPETFLGDACAIVTAMFYAAYQLLVSRGRQHFSALDVMLRSSAASALALLLITLLAGEPLWPRTAHGWSILVALAVISHVGGQGLIAWALAHLPASFSSVALLVQPIAATVFAWLILGEGFGPQQVLGGAIVMAGILICRFAMPAQQPQPEAERAGA
ncbi:MAG TPA: DMT family transporter [Nevskia sp.]|nr:DMT family transporter [Nevskia sp.]